jgi:predicted ATPase/DNA-binding SARP family transcriptional activator
MSELIFSFLGPIQLSHPQIGEITIPKRKALALLTYLVIAVDHPHSRESLLGLLWPEDSTAAAQNSLRVTWSQLQKYLEQAREDAQPYLLSTRLDLQFNPLSKYELDVALFRNLIEACRTHAHPGQSQDCAECAGRLAQAMTLVRGPFLDGFSLPDCPAFDEWLLVQRERLHLQITATLEQLAAFQERAGQLPEAERSIRRLLEYDPLSESAYRQLMQVLARADQRSAALDAYETCRRVLATELGLAPAAETVMLAEQIRGLAPFESHSAHISLPPVLTRFFGRQPESAHLVDLLSRRTVKLVTLAGPGGVGKTRLAIEVARRMAGVFAHDICFVELAGVADARSVDDAVAAALRLPTNAGRSSTDAIVDYLRDKTMLLVLDNCEHLVKACAELVETLCHEAAGLSVLTTSRIPLHLEVEHIVRLEPFATPVFGGTKQLTVADSLSFDSIQLFTNRAAQSLVNFKLTDANVSAVARICQQLDGIPLAIEIAAAQTRALPIEAIAERLDQRFAWHQRSAEPMPRQRTLHTLIDWSYGLLTVPERSVLRRLSVFVGGWTLEAAEAIVAPGEPGAEVLTKLVDHSLVVFGADVGRRRYAMHETIRQFAQEYLRGSDQELDARECHARYYAQIVSRAAENRGGQTLPERLRTVQDDHDNVRLAFEWLLVHDHEQVLALVAQLGTELRFWELGGFFQEGRRWLERALEATQASVSSQRAEALLAAADLSSAITDFAYGLQCARQAQQLFQELGNQRGEIDAQLKYCDLADLAGERASLRAQLAEVLHMAEQMSYTAGIAKAKQLLATIYYKAGESETALQYILPSVALWRELENPFELATALNRLSGPLTEFHEYAAAQQALEECRDIYQSLGYRRGVALATQNLGHHAEALGDYDRARECYREALRIRRDLGLPRGYAYSFEHLADIAEIEKRYEHAVQLLAAADTLRVRLGAPVDQVNQQANEDALTRLRGRLGDVVYELAWAKGATLTTEQAIALALS